MHNNTTLAAPMQQNTMSETIPDAMEMAGGPSQSGNEWHHHHQSLVSSSYQDYGYPVNQGIPHHSLPPLHRFHHLHHHQPREATGSMDFEDAEVEWRHYQHHHHHPPPPLSQHHPHLGGDSSSLNSASLAAASSSGNSSTGIDYTATYGEYEGNSALAETVPCMEKGSPPPPLSAQQQLPQEQSVSIIPVEDLDGEEPESQGHRLRPHSTPATLCWLERNYELSEGVCIPRNVVYFNYVDFCSKNQMQPVNAASFGKIIRQMFANLTTRRLGTRGQSRYHYYGLAVKPDSIYYSPNYSSRKVGSMPLDGKYKMGECGTVSIGQQSPALLITAAPFAAAAAAAGTSGPGFATTQQLPDFPSFREFDQASSIPSDKLQTLVLMYRAHCTRIMDSVNKFSFTEIPHLFTHFWQEIPPHIAGLLGQNIVVTLIGICDAILYRTILKAILPTAIQMFPENVLKIIRKFADDIVCSLQYSLKQVPDNLIYVKMKLVKQLSKMLKRRTSVNHLYQAASTLINPNNDAVYEQMVQEWKKIDIKRIVDECGSKVCSAEEIKSLIERFVGMLEQRSSVGQLCLWMSGVFETFTKSAPDSSGSLISKIRRFLVLWTSISAKLLKQIKQTQRPHATSSYHLLQLMLNEFLLHEIERLVCEDSMKELMLNMVNSQATELSDSSFIDSLGPDFLSSPSLVQLQLHGIRDDEELAQPNSPKRRDIQSTVETAKIKSERNFGYERQIHTLPTLTRGESLMSNSAVSYWNSTACSASEITYSDPLQLTYAVDTTGGQKPKT